MVRLDMKGPMMALLNNSLRLQGIMDVKVCDLSGDFKRASVEHLDDEGRVRYRGVVEAETLLPRGDGE